MKIEFYPKLRDPSELIKDLEGFFSNFSQKKDKWHNKNSSHVTLHVASFSSLILQREATSMEISSSAHPSSSWRHLGLRITSA